MSATVSPAPAQAQAQAQAARAAAFRALHARPGAFVMPNPWDVGSARLLEALGFEALATTSAGLAFSIGQLDYTVGRERVLQHARVLSAATTVPVNGDLENGFADDPEGVARFYAEAGATGLAGGSIEDATGRPGDPIYEPALAAERVRAAAEALRALPGDFVLTARCENYLNGRPDLKDTIRRLQAYQEAGADVLYAPGVIARDDLATLLREVDRPVNVLAGMRGMTLDVAQLADLRVKRISVGGALARAAFGALVTAAREMREQGTFGFAAGAVSYKELSTLLSR